MSIKRIVDCHFILMISSIDVNITPNSCPVFLSMLAMRHCLFDVELACTYVLIDCIAFWSITYEARRRRTVTGRMTIPFPTAKPITIKCKSFSPCTHSKQINSSHNQMLQPNATRITGRTQPQNEAIYSNRTKQPKLNN